nr:hypothetical protein Iba_chr06bCG6960 [Ipomoea batatas]
MAVSCGNLLRRLVCERFNMEHVWMPGTEVGMQRRLGRRLRICKARRRGGLDGDCGDRRRRAEEAWTASLRDEIEKRGRACGEEETAAAATSEAAWRQRREGVEKRGDLGK